MESTNKTTPDKESAHGPGPTLSERIALARAYQQQAMARPDPLAANLGTIAGDLMGIARGLASQVETQLMQGALSEETRRRFLEDMELYLKIVRQSDRLAQIERQLGAASAGKTPAR